MSDAGNWTVVDLFSGAGGMSYGFHAHPNFQVVAAVDAQLSKPSSPRGSLQCNKSYFANMGVTPHEMDLAHVEADELCRRLSQTPGADNPDILISCAPCTGFSRAKASNHLEDDPRNSLVRRTGEFVEALRPRILVMENARELLTGNFATHFHSLKEHLEAMGYVVHADVHMLSRFGLPQLRERALVVAVESGLTLRTLDDVWSGFEVADDAKHVRRAIADYPGLSAGCKASADSWHISPGFSSDDCVERLKRIPTDGGSWADLLQVPDGRDFMTPAMKRSVERGTLGSHSDVYGRMWWDRPAPTIKRECSHVGNGRYAHPVQDRLCSVRELAALQGFPRHYKFMAKGLANMYRHIGDAVPPLISYQIAHTCSWVLSGTKPAIETLILPDTHLTVDDIIKSGVQASDRRVVVPLPRGNGYGPSTVESAQVAG